MVLMKKHICNPINLEYRYQFYRNRDSEGRNLPYTVFREAADPSIILFQGEYYLFPSLAGGFYTSKDLTEWIFHPYLQEMPIYDYAPDVHEIDGWLYVCASRMGQICDFYRSKNPVSEPFERIEGSFDFWDPALFLDDDGKLYFYWGCTNTNPIWGAEIDKETMRIKGEKVALFDSDDQHRGYERFGENHIHPETEESIWARIDYIIDHMGPEQAEAVKDTPREQLRQSMWNYMGGLRPYIEGAWMTKLDGKYYLQYAIPGTECNIYGDGCYVADSPLGPYIPCKNNPYSYRPGGFMPAAGHGSTLNDNAGRLWHASTMRISKSYKFERRLGLWKAGYDSEGGLYCDQRYGDWPMDLDAPLFAKPDWMLLSYGKKAVVSSGDGAENLTDENCQTVWQAEGCDGEWACIDLGKIYDVRAIQLNFADWNLTAHIPEGEQPNAGYYEERWIDMRVQPTQWRLEGSADGENWFVLADKWNAETDLSHDFLTWENGIQLRHVKLTVHHLPYGQAATVSGIRVFGIAHGEKPGKPTIAVDLAGPMDMDVSWNSENSDGAVISWGYAPDKLWHSCMVFGKTKQRIGALVSGEPVYVMVETFNENGISESDVLCGNGITI